MTDLPTVDDLLQQARAALANNLAELDAYQYAQLPDSRDEALTTLIAGYRALGSPADREALARSLSGWQRGTLSSYFNRMAMVAVRTRSIETLSGAAVALAISQYDSDPRELLMNLPLLCRASELLDAGVEPYLQAAADAPSLAVAAVFRSEAASFSSGCGRLPAMLREVQGPNGIIWINAKHPIPAGW